MSISGRFEHLIFMLSPDSLGQLQLTFLPIKSVMLGECTFGIGQVTHIPKHATADRPSGTNRQVGQATVEIAKSQPRFRRQL
jgi:hypothetical protein